MNSPLLMGIDAGSSRVRALIFTPEGLLQAQGSAAPEIQSPRPGWATMRSEDLWECCVQAIREAAAQIDDPKRIRSVAVASVAEAAVPLDAHGNATYPIIAWYDGRTTPQALWLKEHVGAERLFEITGLNANPIFGLCKQMWLRDHEPEVFRSTVSWLNTADFLAWKLCGTPATDYSLASRTLALSLHTLEYADDLLREVQIPRTWYQPLVASGTALGALLPEVARQTGLPPDCQVAAGGHDHFVGALIAGGLVPGTLMNSMGTAEAVTLFTETPVIRQGLAQSGYVQGVLMADRPYYYLLGGLFTSGASVQWFHELTEHRYSHEHLIREAGSVSPGSDGVLFLPHLRVGAPPNPVEVSRGAFLGLGTGARHPTLYRAILEGMACDVRLIAEGLLHASEALQVHEVRCFGGESQNRLLMQIKASVLNRRLTRLEMTEAVSLGAALFGGIGADLFAHLPEALEGLSFASEEILPVPEWAAYYERHYQDVYAKAWAQIWPLQQRILEVQSHSERPPGP